MNSYATYQADRDVAREALLDGVIILADKVKEFSEKDMSVPLNREAFDTALRELVAAWRAYCSLPHGT